MAATLELTLAAGLPQGAQGAWLNVTSTLAADHGFVTFYPCGSPRPNTSSLNVRRGETVSNAVLVSLASGRVCAYASGRTHLVVDGLGVFVPALSPCPAGNSGKACLDEHTLGTCTQG